MIRRMGVTISSLELANVKRIKAVKLEPTATGLTIVGGKNNQGKTSVLDAIAWALGGDKYKPTSYARDGAYTDPILRVELSNGLIVERKGKNISAFALDLPKFMNAQTVKKRIFFYK